MPFQSMVFKVLVASPGDTAHHRAIIERALYDWNCDHDREGPLTLPLLWEIRAVPELVDDDAQSVINRQLVDEADIVFGVFHARLGSPTRRAASGTAEELQRSASAGKKVHVYFSEAQLPYRHDQRQLALLHEFRDQLPGLHRSFTSDGELQTAVRRALEQDLGRPEQPPKQATVAVARPTMEVLAARYGSATAYHDVTETLRSRIAVDGLRFSVRSELFGLDPTAGKSRFLVIVYRVDGREQSRTFREGDAVALP